jgi:hypothetical protein
MHNNVLKADLKEILSDKSKVMIEKSNVGGSSITVINKNSSEDLGCYIYYNRINQRDADFSELEKLLNE